MYQCLRAAGGLPGALLGRTTDPLACAERKQRGEDAPKQIISSHSPWMLLEREQLGNHTQGQTR